MKVLIWVVVVLVVLGGGGYFAYSRYSGGPAEAAEVEVRVEEIAPGSLSEVVTAAGQIEPRTKVQISAKISARIMELPHKEGETVVGEHEGKPGSVLVRLDASDLEASLKAAEARYAAQQAGLEVAEVRIRGRLSEMAGTKVVLADAERDLKRQRALLATGDVSQVTVDTAEVKFDQLQTQLESLERSLEADRANLGVMRHELTAAEAGITQAREQLSYAVIRSPIDGTVTRVNAEAGELVVTGTMNNAGTVIIEVGDLSRMLVEARVDESAVANVAAGQRVTARSSAYPGKAFGGVVQSVALSKSDGTGRGASSSSNGQPYFRTLILLDEVTDGTRLLSGVTADVEIETKRHTDVITVPSQCVVGRPVEALPAEYEDSPLVDRKRTNTAVVFVVKEGKAKIRPVRIGASDATHTLIEAGLENGERVVSGPYKVLASLSDGAKVKVKAPTTKPTTKPATMPTTKPAADGAVTQPVSATRPVAAGR